MKKVFCLILSFFITCSLFAFASCTKEKSNIAAIYTKNDGTIRPIDVYKTEKGTMKAIESKKELEVSPKYKYYCAERQFTVAYPSTPSYYMVGDGVLWAYTKKGIYYTTYWGRDEAVEFSAEISFYKTLHIQLKEKNDTYKISYYDLNGHPINDISQENLDRYKIIVEINKSEITKIDYLV